MTTFEIGHRRPDGKYNVWAKRIVGSEGPGDPEDPEDPRWVIVHVARNGPKAREWVNQQEAAS